MNITQKLYRKVRRRKRGKKASSKDNNHEGWSKHTRTSDSSCTVEGSTAGSVCGDPRDISRPFYAGLDDEEEERGESLEAMLDRGYRRSPPVVGFDDNVEILPILPAYEIDGGTDRRELWVQKDEYKDILWKARRYVKRAHNDTENDYCLRGLEHVIHSLKRTHDARDAVLEEQEYQVDEYIFPLDENRIADVYEAFNEGFRTEARERAEWDAQQVEDYLRSDEVEEEDVGSSSSFRLPSSQPHASSMRRHSLPPKPSFSESSHRPGMMFTRIDQTMPTPPPMFPL